MEFIIVAIITACVFIFCFAVFLLKGHREGGPPRLHRCHDGPDCQCYGQGHSPQGQSSGLVQIMDKPGHGCSSSDH